MKKEEKDIEKKQWKTFLSICYILAFVVLCIGIYIYLNGIPNFSNLEKQKAFCLENGGMIIESSKQTYNNLLCSFIFENTHVMYVAEEITNEFWAEAMGKKVGEYCFTCWDKFSCSSSYNDILEDRGVHC